jgi:N-methylhydantoinase B
MAGTQQADAITTALVEHRLFSIVEEMGEAMLRTAYSQILNSSRDFSCALVDAQLRLVAQAEHVPVHVGAMVWAARAVAEAFPGDVHPGDVFLLNDPYHGGNHLPDLTAFVPVFRGGTLLFWSINRAHQSDIGGATHGAYNPGATEIWQEGIRVPPLKLYDKGVQRDDIVRMLATNVRHGRDFRGDLAAMVGSAKLAERRLTALFAEFGEDRLLAAIEAMLDATERRTRAVISEWQDGVYDGHATLDDDGHGRENIVIRARVTKKGGDLTVDLTGSDPQSTSFVNSSHANMQSAVAMAFAYLIDADIPKNDGAFRALKVVAKPGTVVWASEGAPVTLCTSHCSNEIVEAVITALADACPDRAMAGWGRRFRIAIAGTDPRTRRKFIWHLFHARPGGGASPVGDGWASGGEWHAVGGIKFGSIEVAEVRFPLHFIRHELRPDSGGAGQYHGGAGTELELGIETAEGAVGNTAGDGVRHGSRGLAGGADGKPHNYVLHPKASGARPLRTKEVGVKLSPGDVLVIHSSGGGGWGDPAKRDAAHHAADKLSGLVTDAGRA